MCFLNFLRQEMDDAMGRKPLATLCLKLLSSGQQQRKSAELPSCSPALQQFERFLFSPNLSDIVFVLDSGCEVPAHRIILSSGSPALRALLEDNKSFAEGIRRFLICMIFFFLLFFFANCSWLNSYGAS